MNTLYIFGIIVGYLFMGFFTFNILMIGVSYQDEPPMFIGAVLWPITLPCWAGWKLSRYFTKSV